MASLWCHVGRPVGACVELKANELIKSTNQARSAGVNIAEDLTRKRRMHW